MSENRKGGYKKNFRNRKYENKTSTENRKCFLNERETVNILKRFPEFELSYEKLIHKKVSSDIYVAIPKGRKYLLWFTYYKDKNVCFLMELTGRKLIFKSMESVTVSFKDKLSFGTILYGTVINYDKSRFFVTENIYYYKGRDISKSVFSEKLKTITTLFKNELKQISYGNSGISIGLSVIKTTYQEAVDMAETLPYQIYCIQSRLIHTNANFLNYIHETTEKNMVFQIRADIQNDIYNLYCYKNGEFEFYDIAQIQNYKTSVQMNRLFRKIKENQNLDYLEESDDEDEFENVNPDKFVDLSKRINMVCTFNSKFNRWSPLRTVSSNDKVSTFQDLQIIRNKNRSGIGSTSGCNSGNSNQNRKIKNSYSKNKNSHKTNYGNRYTNNYGNTYKRDYYR